MRKKLSSFRAVRWIVPALMVSIVCASVGCESFTSTTAAGKKKKKDSSWFSFKKKEYQIPQNMNVTWSNDVLTLPGKPPTRGFGGRFYFYNERSQAIPVDGELVVYAFDDTDSKHRPEELDRADKVFRFPAEQFTNHFSESDLGASYSVWIPWDAAHGKQKRIMLIPTFKTKDDRLVRGAPATLSLPGKSSEEFSQEIMQTSAMIPTSLPGQVAGARNVVTNQNGLRTTTIQVPPRTLQKQPNAPELGDAALAATTMSGNAAITQYPSLAQAQNYAATQAAANSAAIAAVNQQAALLQESLNANRSPLPNVANTAALGANAAGVGAPSSPLHTNNPIGPMFTPPTSAPVTASQMQTRTVNGWVQPEFAQPNWTGLSVHSSQNQFQAPTSTAAQPNAYLAR